MADPVDISQMPDPGTIGLAPPDPAAGMPEPAALYKQHHGYDAQSPEDLAEFMRDPDATPDVRKAKSAAYGASLLTGLPRAAAGYAAAVPAGAASIAGQATGALGAALDPDNASSYLEQGRDRGREWAANVSNLANYVPATKPGAELSNALMAAPGDIVKGTAGAALQSVLPDNAYQAVSDVAQDVGNDLPALGVPGAVRAGARAVGAAGRAAKGAFAAGEAPPGTTYDQAGNVQAPTTALKPDVDVPVTGAALRAQPNPIPAEGTIHNQVHPASLAPEAASAAPTPPAPAPTFESPDAAPTEAPTESQAGTTPSSTQGTGEPLTAPASSPTIAEGASSSAPQVTLPDSDNTPLDMSLPPEQRALIREGVAARRAAAESQRGSTQLFNQPSDTGPQATPEPVQQSARAQSLDDIDQLSGGMLPSRRASAISGDYNATGDDYQLKEVGSEPMRQQIASENDAMHAATENVHTSTGSNFSNSVDPQTVSDRGRVTRGAIQKIQNFFQTATDDSYDAARANSGDQPMPNFLGRVDSFLKDDANYMPEGFRRSAQARLNQLKTAGDNGIASGDKPAAPSSVAAAEKFREWLNQNRTLDNMHTVKQMVDHTDTDVAEHGGPGLFQTARLMRRQQYQMLEEPSGIKKLLTPSDSQGINHAIPEHKVMDYIADLPREQHEKVLNVLRSGAHLGGGGLAEDSAGAIREIQAHMISRMHDAATNADGTWNARKFYNQASSYAPKLGDTFKDQPKTLRNLQTINRAGNTLSMDKHYPGAAAQAERTGLGAAALKGAGNIAASVAHEIPVVGRLVGRGIEGAVEGMSEKGREAARDKAAISRLVDRTGKQRGSVGVLPQRDAIKRKSEPLNGSIVHRYTVPDTKPDPSFPNANGGGMTAVEHPELGVTQVQTSNVVDKGKGWGTRMLQRAADDAHARGQVLHSDQQVSEGQVGAYKNLAKLGYDVQMKPNKRVQGEYRAHGDHVFEVRPPKDNGATLNVGLHQGQEGQPGFRKMSKQEATGAIESTGAKVTKGSVLTPAAHGVAEPTLVASTNRALSEPEMQKVLSKTKQSAIPQRTDAGVESMHVAPGHEAIAKAEGWDKFNPEYFRDHEGKVKAPSGQRGSFSFQNDNELNRATAGSRRGQTSGERNPRSEYNANRQIAGQPELSPERAELLRRLSGQRGSVRVMNEKPLEGAPEGDRPNGKARAAAAAYAKSAGIDYTPLKDYRYIDPAVAKNVADAYDAMKHDPTDPKVAKSYDAFKAETLAQYKQMQKAGVKVDLNKDYPYTNPREMHEDVRANNHMSVYPTEEGFGSGGGVTGSDVAKHIKDTSASISDQSVKDLLGKNINGNYKKVDMPLDKVDADTPISTGVVKRYAERNTPFPAIVTDSNGKVVDGNHRVAAARMRGDTTIPAYVPEEPHPLMEKAPVKMGGKDATYNDLFRAVHDYYGHAAEGNGFRANGEYNAWRAHRQMYSPAARGAMDAETLGQNSWVNSGPAGALNQGASGADTIYADQKAGLLPPKVVKSAEEGVGADEHHVTNQLTDQERGQLRADSTQRLMEAFHNSPATEEYAAAAMAGAAKRGWYKQSSQAIVNTFGHEAPRFAALLSAMSPQVSVQTNFANALKTYVNWDKEGRPTDPSDIRRIMEESSQKSAKNTDRTNVLDAWVNNGVRALTADDPSNVKLSGPKVHSFYNNLTDNVNEVTNDAWMASFAKIDPRKLGGALNQSGPGKSATYLALSGKVRAAASLLSRMTGETWTPAEVQETVWSWAKTAYEHAEEKGDRTIPELVKNGDITDDLIRSTPDFHQLFSTEQHRGLLQSSRFAGDAERVAPGKEQGANTAGTSQARQAAQEALRPHLISAAERLEALRQERRASGESAPKED